MTPRSDWEDQPVLCLLHENAALSDELESAQAMIADLRALLRAANAKLVARLTDHEKGRIACATTG